MIFCFIVGYSDALTLKTDDSCPKCSRLGKQELFKFGNISCSLKKEIVQVFATIGLFADETMGGGGLLSYDTLVLAASGAAVGIFALVQKLQRKDILYWSKKIAIQTYFLY